MRSELASRWYRTDESFEPGTADMSQFPLCNRCLAVLLLIGSWAVAQEAPPASSQPLSPAEAIAKFVLAEPELKIELAAAEPEVVDPIAIRFDERGRMWVVEMRDYPLGPP